MYRQDFWIFRTLLNQYPLEPKNLPKCHMFSIQKGDEFKSMFSIHQFNIVGSKDEQKKIKNDVNSMTFQNSFTHIESKVQVY